MRSASGDRCCARRRARALTRLPARGCWQRALATMLARLASCRAPVEGASGAATRRSDARLVIAVAAVLPRAAAASCSRRSLQRVPSRGDAHAAAAAAAAVNLRHTQPARAGAPPAAHGADAAAAGDDNGCSEDDVECHDTPFSRQSRDAPAELDRLLVRPPPPRHSLRACLSCCARRSVEGRCSSPRVTAARPPVRRRCCHPRCAKPWTSTRRRARRARTHTLSRTPPVAPACAAASPALPAAHSAVRPREQLLELVMDLGRVPIARFPAGRASAATRAEAAARERRR